MLRSRSPKNNSFELSLNAKMVFPAEENAECNISDESTRCKFSWPQGVKVTPNGAENLWLKFATTVNVHFMGVDYVPGFREKRLKPVQTRQRAFLLKYVDSVVYEPH